MLRNFLFARKHYSQLSSTSCHQVIALPCLPSAMQNTTSHTSSNSRLYSDHTIHRLPSRVLSILTGEETEPSKLDRIRASPHMLEHFVNVNNVRHVAESLARKEPSYVTQFITLSRKLGCQHKLNVYECVCFRLADANHWHLILSVVSLGTDHTGKTTSRLLNWKARSLLELKRYGQLSGVLEEFKLHNLKPSRRTYHLVLSGHLRNCDMLQARDCLRSMEEAGFPPDPLTHSIVATNHRLLGLDTNVESRAMRALGGMDSAEGASTLTSLIQLRLSRHDIPGALHLFTHFNPSSVRVLVSALSIPAGASSFSHEPDPTLEKSPVPNASTYAIVIRYLAGRVGIDVILDVLRAMNVNGIKATSAVIISLIRALASAGYIGIAGKLITDICEKPKDSGVILASLVSDTRDLHLPVDCTGVKPSAALFNAFLEHSLEVCGFKAILIVLRVMRINRVIPNSGTSDVFISYLLRRENVRPRSMLRLLQHLYSDPVSPTLRHLHIILSCILRHEKFLLYGSGWNRALYSFRSQDTPRRPFPESRITNTSDSYDPTAGLQMSRYKRYKTLARHLTELLAVHQTKSDPATFAIRIKHDAVIRSDIDSAKDVFRSLLSRGMHATEYHYSALMEGYATSGEMDQAEDLLRSMRNVGLKPNVVTYTILIHGYGRNRNPSKALKSFQQMIDDGCQPDVPAIDALCCAFYASGAHNTARKLLVSCWVYIQPFPNKFRFFPLRELIIRFRALHRDGQSVPQKESNQRRRLVYHRIQRILERWKSISGLPRLAGTVGQRKRRRPRIGERQNKQRGQALGKWG